MTACIPRTRKKCFAKTQWAAQRRYEEVRDSEEGISPLSSEQHFSTGEQFRKKPAFICLNNSSQWPETLPLPLQQTVAAIAPTKDNKEYNNKEENNNNNDSGENYNKCYINYTYNIKTGQFLI